MDFITLILHRGGKLLRNEQNVLEYVGGEVDVWDELDCDLLNRFLIIDLCKLHKYHDIQHCFWLYPERNLEHPVIPDECVVFSKVAVVDETGDGDINSSVEIIVVEVAAKDPDEEEDVESRVEVLVEEPAEEDEEIPAEVPLEQPAEEDEDIPVEDVVEQAAEEDEDIPAEVVVEQAAEEDEDIPADVVVDEGLEEDSVSDVHSDSYESAEDSIYRPSPIVSTDNEEVTPIVVEIRSKKLNDVCAAKKGKNVVETSKKGNGSNRMQKI
ncbi:hypothetical protein SESBI_46182 [Sesbania bispinosa]|nr:hypothetical protein SESBI_46182 [Sesbania bispinosa]